MVESLTDGRWSTKVMMDDCEVLAERMGIFTTDTGRVATSMFRARAFMGPLMPTVPEAYALP